MTKLSIHKDINGIPIYLLDFPVLKYSAALTTGVERTLTVPGSLSSNNLTAVFRHEAGTTVWFALNATAAGPAGATIEPTTSCGPNYPGTKVKSGDVLHFITADTTAELGIELYEF